MYDELMTSLQQNGIVFGRHVPAGELTTFHTGGSIDMVIYADNLSHLETALELTQNYNVRMIGNGSNLLVGSGGYNGIVIKLIPGNGNILIEENRVWAFGGTYLSQCASAALESGLSGMECLAGIPGSVGGAVYMNAGAYGGTVADVLNSSLCWAEGKTISLSASQHKFGYRESIYKEHPSWVCSQACFSLTPSPKEEIAAKMKELSLRRRTSQPLELPSAGSVFKRPQGHFAGKLIEDAHLKGISIGGAQVSPKHAGFIVNTGNASPEDVLRLIRLIQKTVYETFGVKLEREVELMGRFLGCEDDLWSF